jgi:hypothetical protein
MPDFTHRTLEAADLTRSITRRLMALTVIELRLADQVTARIEALRGRSTPSILDAVLADALAELAGDERAAAAKHAADRVAMLGPDAAREWHDEGGTVASGESLAIARTVTAERSDPYETVVVEDEVRR